MSIHLKQTLEVIKRYYPPFEYTVFDNTPVSPLKKPLNKCRLALVTTGGLHLKQDRPFDTKSREGDCSYRILPADVKHDQIMISHEFYRHDSVNKDLNCVFPIDRMREYQRAGRIGGLSEEHYSFMGHIYVTAPLIENAKKVGRRLQKLSVDIAFLTPT